MTRAPLPGKLPELPEKPVFINDSTLRYVTEDWRIEDFKTSEGNNAIVLWGYEQRRAAYWESRARLAVKTLEDCARWLENDADQDVVQRIITQIGPLPEEDRT